MSLLAAATICAQSANPCDRRERLCQGTVGSTLEGDVPVAGRAGSVSDEVAEGATPTIEVGVVNSTPPIL